MSATKLIAAPLKYKLAHPLHIRLILADIFSVDSQPSMDHPAHLTAAIDWLCRAQDARAAFLDRGGVSAGWNFGDGWLPSYPETTGYIIETFLAAAKVLNRLELRERAGRMVDWELSIQYEDGAFPGHFGEPGNRPVIFNTGQIMHGMIAGYRSLGRKECLAAGVRAGHWLARQQDADGCWRKFEYRNLPHVYNTRATWALLATGLLAGKHELRDAAIRNLDWALRQQRESGWFANNTFTAGRNPVTHTIAYAIRGLVECGTLLNEPRYLDAALKAARGVASAQRADGWLAGTLDAAWQPSARYCCLTGVAQMCLNWIRLAQETGADELRGHARRGIAYLKRTQRLDDASEAVRGAIAGSSPIWGRYSMFEYPNWAAKFFSDALMMDMDGHCIPPKLSLANGQPEERTRV